MPRVRRCRAEPSIGARLRPAALAPASESLPLLKNIGSTWLYTLATVAATYLLLPFTIRVLGAEGYGTWILLGSLTGYLGLLKLGVPMASVRHFARLTGTTQRAALNEAIASCMRLYTLLGAGTLVLGAGMFAFFTTLYDVPAALLPAARTAFAIVVLNVACGFVAQVPLGILAAHHDFVVRNAVQVGGVLLRVLLTLVLLTLDASIVWLAVVDATVMVAEFAAMCAVVRRRYPGVRLSPAGARWSTIRAILSFSVFVLVLQVGSRLTFKSDALVVGAFLTLAHVTFYAVANSIAVYVMEFLVAIGDVAMPTVARLHHQQRNAELQQLFLKWSKIAFSVTLVAVLFLGVAGPRVIAWWVDPTFEEPAGAVLRVLMLSNLVFLPVRSMALPVLMGLGRPQRATIAFLVAGVLNLALSIALVGPLGLVGVALGTAIPNVLVAGYVLHVTCEALSLPLPTYLRYVGGRALLGAVPVLLALLLVLREFPPQDFLALFAVGVATLALSAVVAVAFVYRGDPNVDIRAALPRLLSWRRA